MSSKSVEGRAVVRFLRKNRKQESFQQYENSIKTSELIWICSYRLNNEQIFKYA